MTDERGPWIQTYTGKQFFLLNPRPEDIDIEDIAHSLSNQCRFNGHCNRFYSVAEHSYWVSTLVPPELALAGLLHDSAEAYFLSDITAPLKEIMPQVFVWEARIEAAICIAFDLKTLHHAAIKHADRQMLATEKAKIMSAEPAPWKALPEPTPGLRLACWSPEHAKEVFMMRFLELRG